jgi:acyl-CoA hydrolase
LVIKLTDDQNFRWLQLVIILFARTAPMTTTVVPTTARVLNSNLAQKIMSADEAAALIHSGDQVGMSGFTGSGYPKAVPIELARRISDANFRGQKFQVSVFTGASTGPELDGALAMAGGIHLRLPYQSDPETRKRINAGEISGQDGRCADRSGRGAGRRTAAAEFVDRQQQNVD